MRYGLLQLHHIKRARGEGETAGDGHTLLLADDEGSAPRDRADIERAVAKRAGTPRKIDDARRTVDQMRSAAVALTKKCNSAAVVGDGGAAGRARVVENGGAAAVRDCGAAGRAGLEELGCAAAVVGDAGVAGGAG